MEWSIQADPARYVLRKELRRMAEPIIVRAKWDPEAEVWYTEHSSLPGLNLEAETIDELRGKLPGAIEDLLEGAGEREVSFELVTSGLVKIST
jgi:predicted RNase H-like HicB family nuclease